MTRAVPDLRCATTFSDQTIAFRLNHKDCP